MKSKSFNKKSDESRAVANHSGAVPKKRNNILPEDLQQKMEQAFGQDFWGVSIQQNSQQAKQLNALAYTQGEKIHFAPGQFNPHTRAGKHLIGHELTHVVQQRNGRVKPTAVLGKKFPVNNEHRLEHEADYFGKKAVQAETLPKYRFSNFDVKSSTAPAQAKSQVIQRAVKTWGGEWDTDKYDLRKDQVGGTAYPAAHGIRGVDIKLRFKPGDNADAELIGLTQSVQGIVNSTLNLTPAAATRNIKSADAININTGTGETDEGTAIDRASGFNNPIYAVDTQPSTKLDDPSTDAGWGQHGWHNSAKSPKKRDALLIDAPTRTGAAKDSRHIFETAAIATKGVQKGTYYGSVRWGWRTDSSSNFTKIPLQVISQGAPSSTFFKAAELWNAAKDSTGADTVDLPLIDVKLTTSTVTGQYPPNFVGPPLSIPANTRVQIIKNAVAPDKNGQIKVVDGTFVGNTLEITPSDMAKLKDERS